MQPLPLSEMGKIRFGDIVVDRGAFSVFRGEVQCEVTPRAFDVLILLIENRGRVVEKQEIFDAVWKDTFVTDNALMRAIRELRRELGDSATEPKFIETVHKRGYKFIAPIDQVPEQVIENEAISAPTLPANPATLVPVIDEVREAEPRPERKGSIRLFAFGLLIAAIVGSAAIAFYYNRGERPIRSIAVMPMENASSNVDTEHISDGIVESLINSLSELPELKVVARATVFRYRGQEFDPEKIRRELGVDAILTGRVMQTGDDLTVQADLISASDGSQIWGSRYSRKIKAAYELPGAIAFDLTKKLDLGLTNEQANRLTKNYTENSEAYQLYLRGLFFWNKRSEDALNKSIEYFLRAIEKDPNYALAFAGLADSYAVMAISADLPAHDVFPKAKVAAARALELDNSLVEAHATMLRIKSQYDWDWGGAEEEYRTALKLNPNYPMTHVYYMSYLVAVGRSEEAVASVKRAQELDPLSLVANAVVARALFFAGRYDEAIEASLATLELDKDVYLARLILGRSYARKGMYDEAIAELELARKLPSSNSESTSLLAYTYAVSGRSNEAGRLLDELKELSATRYVQPYDLAIVYTGLGDQDSVFEWLEKAYQHRNHQVSLIRAVPEFEDIRSDSRFRNLVDRIGG